MMFVTIHFFCHCSIPVVQSKDNQIRSGDNYERWKLEQFEVDVKIQKLRRYFVRKLKVFSSAAEVKTAYPNVLKVAS